MSMTWLSSMHTLIMVSLEQLQEQVEEDMVGLHEALTDVAADVWQLTEDRYVHYRWLCLFLTQHKLMVRLLHELATAADTRHSDNEDKHHNNDNHHCHRPGSWWQQQWLPPQQQQQQ